jgi:hypothetical protein
MADQELEAYTQYLAAALYRHRNQQIDIAIAEATKAGIPNDLVEKALSTPPDIDAIRQLCIELKKQQIAKRKAEKKGKSHLVRKHRFSGDALVNFLAAVMLENCVGLQGPPPGELVQVISSQLGSLSFGTKMKSRDHKKTWAIYLRALDPDIGNSDIARKVGVHKSTVTNWMKDPEFNRSVNRLRKDSDTMAKLPNYIEALQEEALLMKSLWESSFPKHVD